MTEVTPRPKAPPKKKAPKKPMVPRPSPKKRPAKKRTAKPSTDKAVATRLHSAIVRSRGFCEYHAWISADPLKPKKIEGAPLQCSGPLQAAHVVRRGSSGTRTDVENARCLCREHHTFLDHHPAEWVAWIGIDEMRRLEAKARAWTNREHGMTPRMFWREERARLQALADEMGLKLR